MTEQNWADQLEPLARQITYQCDEGPIREYKELLGIWADWCEDGNADYGPGLRLIAAGYKFETARPGPFTARGVNNTYGWCFHHEGLVSSVPEYVAYAIYTSVEDPKELSFLDAMRDAARAWQKGKSP
jgi:hypothetical protein